MTEAVAPQGFAARITLPDGTIRNVTLEGVGCSVSICSRVVIKGKTRGHEWVSFPLSSIATIKDTALGEALLVMKDSTEQRISLVTDFRVAYVADLSHGAKKVDLTRIQSLDFLP